VKLALVSKLHDADLTWAVVVDADGEMPDVVALFAYADQATRWGDENYKGRFKVMQAVRVTP
jgi:hypothetical protein